MIKRLIKDERGDAPLILLLIAITCACGVVGFDCSRTHAVRARVQTAADAASLAGAMQAKSIARYENVFLDADGNETTNPLDAVKIEAKVKGWYFDLQDPDVQENALTAAKGAFAKNFKGDKMPVKQAVGPGEITELPNRLDGYDFEAQVDWNSPTYASDGSAYYDKYVVPIAETGVRSFLLVKLCRLFQGEDVFKEVVDAPRPDDWTGAIRLKVNSKSQAIPVSPAT